MQIDMQHVLLKTIHTTTRPEGFELLIKSCYMDGGRQDKSCGCRWLANVVVLPDCGGGSVGRTEGSPILRQS